MVSIDGVTCRLESFFAVTGDDIYIWKTTARLDFRRLPGPVFDPPRKERDECGMSVSGDECGLIFPNSGW